MNNKSIEVEAALRLALEALKIVFDQTCSVGRQKDWQQIHETISAVKEALAQQSNEGFGYNIVKPYAFEAPNGELRKTAEAKDSSEWGAKFKPLYEQQSNEQVEPVAKVDSCFDSQVVWYLDQLPKDGTKLYTHPSVPYVTESRDASTKLMAQHLGENT